MKKVLQFVAGFSAGIAAGVGIQALKRESDRVAALLTGVHHDICKGFDVDGLHCINTGGVTCYLLKGEDGYLLVDTGYAKGWDIFCASLEQAGIDLNEIKALLLTHSHPDHIGFADKVLTHSDAKLIMHRSAVQALNGDMAGFKDVRPLNIRVIVKLLLMLPAFMQGMEPASLSTEGAILIDDDSTILREMGFDADILVTPGHSPDSITVLTGDMQAIVGDLFMSIPLVEDMHFRPFIHTGEETVLASWRKLLNAGAQVIYPAHGTPIHRDAIHDALTLLTCK